MGLILLRINQGTIFDTFVSYLGKLAFTVSSKS